MTLKTETQRQGLLNQFLSQCGLGAAQSETVAGDASFRRYDRLSHKGKNFILMDAPPPEEDCLPFVAVSHYLEGLGFSSPKVIEQDLKTGFLLLEDLGDDTFNRVFKRSSNDEALLYQGSIDVLADLHKEAIPLTLQDSKGNDHPLITYDNALFTRELDLFTQWYLPALKGNDNSEHQEVLRGLWQPLEPLVMPTKPALVLRDYHADNLMWMPERKGLKQVGLLDFQDAVLGHPAYDLVSLLMDARRDVPEPLMTKMVNHYIENSNTSIEREEFWTAFHILGAQRNLKIIGIFTRLWQRDKKPHYPTMIPHVWGLLERNLEHPILASLKSWIDDLVSPKERQLILSQGELSNE